MTRAADGCLALLVGWIAATDCSSQPHHQLGLSDDQQLWRAEGPYSQTISARRIRPLRSELLPNSIQMASPFAEIGGAPWAGGLCSDSLHKHLPAPAVPCGMWGTGCYRRWYWCHAQHSAGAGEHLHWDISASCPQCVCYTWHMWGGPYHAAACACYIDTDLTCLLCFLVM